MHGLAAVAYHLLTGHVARDGGVRELTNAKLPPAPSVFVEVSPEVDAAILRGLEPDRGGPVAGHRSPSSRPDGHRAGRRRRHHHRRAAAARGRRRLPRRSAAVLPVAMLAVLCVVVALAMFGASYAVVTSLQ